MDGIIYDAEIVKRWLIKYLEDERDIDNQIERLEHLKVRMVGVGAQVLTDMPKSPSATNDRMTVLLAQKEDLEALIRAEVTAQSLERQRIDDVVKNLRNPDERAVIRMKYFDRFRWPEINDMLFGQKADFDEKKETYERRTYRIHASALVNMADHMNSLHGANTAILAEV